MTKISEILLEGNEMIQNLLDVTYIDEQKIHLHISEIDLYEFMHEMLEQLRPLAEQKNIRIDMQLEVSELVIHTDTLKLRRIVDNILSNAIKFSHSGKDVQVMVKDEDDKIVISVKDEGQGMDGEDMKQLFKKFSRLKPIPTAGESSTGMGLYIVKKICEILEGEVWCDSTPGRGSTFYVKIPKKIKASS
jgi:signal transduction histidine kinase